MKKSSTLPHCHNNVNSCFSWTKSTGNIDVVGVPYVWFLSDFSFIVITSLLKEMQKGNHQFKLPRLSDPTDSELLLPFLSARHSARLAFVGQWGWRGRSRDGVGRPAASSVGTAQIKASLGMSTLPGDSVCPKSGCASCYWARDVRLCFQPWPPEKKESWEHLGVSLGDRRRQGTENTPPSAVGVSTERGHSFSSRRLVCDKKKFTQSKAGT